MMSRIAPRVQRTSLVSAAGGYWKCIPRTVPFLQIEGEVRLGDDRLESVRLEFVLAKGAREEAPGVFPALEVDDECAPQLGFGKDHWIRLRNEEVDAFTANPGAASKKSYQCYEGRRTLSKLELRNGIPARFQRCEHERRSTDRVGNPRTQHAPELHHPRLRGTFVVKRHTVHLSRSGRSRRLRTLCRGDQTDRFKA